ncbi:MAG: hypothetical protein R3290_11325 [Acidimicrobiia bacterium]|nr:hypothetical protein [Acidimicrobiia bacterium]
MRTTRWGVLGLTMALVLGLMAPAGAATPTDYAQGFEVDASGWFDADDAWFGDITRVPSGTNGIPSSQGAFHAEVNETLTGPYSRFAGYSDTWPGTFWEARLDVYLDPAWTPGSGFDVSTAANGSDGFHQRDYIFHVGVVDDGDANDGKLLVNGSNNADFTTNDFKLQNENGGVFYEVTSAGWYTLQWIFRDDGGALVVDLSLLDATGSMLWTVTRGPGATDLIPSEVGGNRYMWFTHVEVTDLAVDDQQLCVGGCTTLREDKEAALDLLFSIYPTGDKKVDKRILEAVESIGDSLADEFWADDSSLVYKDGKKVFDEEAKAAKELSKKEMADVPEAAEVVAILLDVDEALAQGAIDAATAAINDAGCDTTPTKDCEKAQKELDKALERMAKAAGEAADKPDKAIKEYKKAWEHAFKAIEKLG